MRRKPASLWCIGRPQMLGPCFTLLLHPSEATSVMHLFHIPKPCWPLLSQWSGGCRIPQLSVWEQKPSLQGSPLKYQVVGVTLFWRKGLSVVPLPNLPEEYMPQDCIHPLGNPGQPDYYNSFSIHCEVRKSVTIQRYYRKARDIGMDVHSVLQQRRLMVSHDWTVPAFRRGWCGESEIVLFTTSVWLISILCLSEVLKILNWIPVLS